MGSLQYHEGRLEATATGSMVASMQDDVSFGFVTAAAAFVVWGFESGFDIISVLCGFATPAF